MRMHLASLVDEWRAAQGEIAVVDHRGNRAFRTLYPELALLAGRFAAELDLRGIVPGERVILWGNNSAEWIAVFFGCVLRGVLPVPLDAQGSSDLAVRVIAEVNPRLIVGGLHRPQPWASDKPWLPLADLQNHLPPDPLFAVDPAVTLDTPVQIIFTSGTTSAPKGVVHTHRNILASVGPIERELAKYRRYERPFHPLRFLHTLPLSHVFGQFMGMWLPPLLRGEVHFIDSVEPARLLAIARRERISVLVAVPRILQLLRTHLQGRLPDLAARLEESRGAPAWKRWWRFREVHGLLGWKFWALICGGATLPGDLEAFWNGLGLALIQGYGLTETAALVTLNHPFHAGRGTLGKALPGREVRLGSEGEIQVRGDMLAAGAWRGGRFEPRTEEWLSTGDLGMQEPSGELRFLGRQGDVIVTAAGLNVHPQDLEAALLVQTGVRGCAVVGCETPRGQQPVAVVLFDGDAERFASLREAANARLAEFQQLHYVLRWPEPQLPFGSTGKLLRRPVAAWACGQIGSQTREALSPDLTAEDGLLSLIGEITREPVASGAGTQRLTEDLHLDSLGRVQLQSALAERYGAEIDDNTVATLETLGELRRLLGVPATNAMEAQPPGSASGVSIAPACSTGSDRAVRYARWPWSAPVRWLRVAFTECVLRPLVRLLVAPRADGTQWRPAAGPQLLIANHVNTFDLPLLLYALPAPLRWHLATAMSAEVLADLRDGRGQGSPWRNLLARPAYWLLPALFNVFPLPRLSGFRRSFAHAGEALDRGYSVLIFPEGRRSGTGASQEFRPGIGLLVQAAGVPVVPVALRGVGSLARRDGRWFRTGNVSVHFGEPLKFAADIAPAAIVKALERALAALEPG